MFNFTFNTHIKTQIFFAIIFVLFGYFFIYPSNEENFENCDLEKLQRMATSRNLSAWMLGGTGLAGKEIVKELALHPEITKVTLISRKLMDLPKTPIYEKFDQKLIDFEELANGENSQEFEQLFKGYTLGFCALGIAQSLVDAKTYVRINKDYPVAAAKYAKSGGTMHFSLITGAGSNSNSIISGIKVKGQLEDEIKAMGFERFSAFRPGLILSDISEGRSTSAKCLNAIFRIVDFANLLSVESSMLAKAMILNVFKPCQTTFEILSHREMVNLVKEDKNKEKNKDKNVQESSSSNTK